MSALKREPEVTAKARFRSSVSSRSGPPGSQDLAARAPGPQPTRIEAIKSPVDEAIKATSSGFALPSGALGLMLVGMALNPSLAQAQFGPHYHACAFVMGSDEERDVVDPFVIDGVNRGIRTMYIVDPQKRDETDARLRASAPADDLLDVTTWHQAHLKGGSFDQDRMIKLLEDLLRDHAATGRAPMRLVGQMAWMFTNPPGIEQLVEYEATVNAVLQRGRTPTVCVYDARRLSGAILMDLLRAHPLAIMSGVLHENPFYTPADEMLRELRRRRAMS